MQSEVKVGLVVVGIAAVGLGAWFAGRKANDSDKPTATGNGTGVVDNSTGDREDEDSVVYSDSGGQSGLRGSAAGEDTHTSNSDRVASPPPIGLNDDSERSWRPRSMETPTTPTPVPAVAPRTGLAGTDETVPEEEHTIRDSERGVATPDAASGELSTVDLTAEPPAGRPGRTDESVRAAQEDTDRLSLRDQTTTTRPADTTAPVVTRGSSGETARMSVHVVQAGETFSSIAAKYLGNGNQYPLIAKANPKLDPRRLRVGDKVNIPAAPVTTADTGRTAPQPGTTAVAPATASTPRGRISEPPPPIAPGRAYTVQAGEGWWELSQRFLGDGNRWPELFEENRERASWNLRAGTVIQVPTTAPAGSR